MTLQTHSTCYIEYLNGDDSRVPALFPPGRVHAIQQAKLVVRIQDRIFSRLDDGSKVDLIDYTG